MGDVYMVNGKILSGLPNHAKDIEFDNTGTTLSSTNTEDAIKEVNSNLTVRYNPTTDMIQILINGTWQDWKQAYMQGLTIFADGQYGSSFAKGADYVLNSSYTTDGGYSVVANNIQLVSPTTNKHSRGSYITPSINLSQYTSATINFNDGSSKTATLDLSNVTGNGYCYVAVNKTTSGTVFFVFGFSRNNSGIPTDIVSTGETYYYTAQAVNVSSIILS